MRICAIILLGLISCKTAQLTQNTASKPSIVSTPFVAVWICKQESWVQNYKVQKNKTTNKSGWTTLGQPIIPKFNKDSSIYTYQLPKTSLPNYYRVLATGLIYDYVKKKIVTVTFNTDLIFLSTTNLK